MEGEQVEYLLSTIENILENQRVFQARLEAAELAIQAQPDRSNGVVRSAMEIEQESSDDDICLDSESDSVDSLGGQPTLTNPSRQHIPRRSGISSLPIADRGGAASDAFSQASTMAACGAELLRVALSSPQIDRRLAGLASDVFAVLNDTLAGLRDLHTDHLSNMAGESDASGHSQSTRPSTRWWGRRVSRSGTNEPSHPYLQDIPPPGSPQELHSGNSNPSAERRDDTTADTDIPVRIPSVVGSPGASIDMEDVSPATTAFATEPDSDGVAEEVTNGVGNASVTDLSMTAMVEPDPTPNQRLTNVLNRQEVIRDALLRQGLSESDVTDYFNRVAKSTNHSKN
ncbi:hypothetical protein FBU31_004677, partial [Coemansia sp. 'formosensis']